jgi:hypothetical protein
VNSGSIKTALATFVLLAVAGCGAPSPSAIESRITEAFPVADHVQKARSRMEGFLVTSPGGAELFKEEFAARLKLRALGCAQGIEHSRSDSAGKIRQQLSGDCFRRADEDLQAWLGRRILGQLLVAPALRPVPATPAAVLSTSKTLYQMRFASGAGVAVATGGGKYEVLDVASGESLHAGEQTGSYGNSSGMSSNGRVFAMLENAEGVKLRESETSELLATWPDHNAFTFLDGEMALAVRRNGATELLDLAAGTAKPVNGVAHFSRVWPVPGSAGEFVVLGNSRRISLVRLERDTSGARLVLVNQQDAPAGVSPDYSDDRSADLRSVYLVENGQVWRLDIGTLSTERLPIDGLLVMSATPLPDPDKLLLRIRLPARGDSRISAVYSIAERSFAPLQEGDFSKHESSLRITGVPALGRIGVFYDRSLRLADNLPVGHRYSSASFNHYLEQQTRQWLASLERFDSSMRGRSAVSEASTRPTDPALLAASAGSRIEVVGVYEPKKTYSGSGPRAGVNSGASYNRSPVSVLVQASDRPLVLVLASYEATTWQVILSRNANLKAVLLSSYERSAVMGIGDVRVVNIGRQYAYKRDSIEFTKLSEELQRITGRTIDRFQGAYSGDSFMVGGN